MEKVMEDAVTVPTEKDDRRGPFYTFFVDDREFHIESETITGGAIMDLAGIPRDVGLILILDDGTQRAIPADELVELKPGRRFKRAPRFKRG
jgi:hypothetical protein